MLQLKNTTPFEGTILLTPDPDGVESLYAIVKGTFTLGEKVLIAAKKDPIVVADMFSGEPGQSSLNVPSDLGLMKPGTDVLLLGTAYCPNGKAIPAMDVLLAVGPISKAVRVFGNRVWKSGIWGDKPSEPEPFQKMPLSWEYAFGGTDRVNGSQSQVQAENRNPVGLGFRVKEGQKKLDGMKLPNLESPKQLISSWKDRPPPASYGPICPTWEPRRSYAGTYDAAWQKNRAPFLPKDFDPRFFQLAPPDQVVPGFLKGGEAVEVRGATPSGLLRFQLPKYQVQAVFLLAQEEHVRPACLDTVFIEPDRNVLVLLWKAVFPCDKKALRIREVHLALAPSA